LESYFNIETGCTRRGGVLLGQLSTAIGAMLMVGGVTESWSAVAGVGIAVIGFCNFLVWLKGDTELLEPGEARPTE